MDTIATKSNYDGVTTPAPSNEVHAADEFNDRNVEIQGAVTDSVQSLDSADAGQLSKAMFANGVAAQSMQDNGSANTVQLTPITGASGLRVATPIIKTYDLLDGAIFSFAAAATNTGNMTVSVGQAVGTLIGAESLFLEDGTTQIPTDAVVAGQYYSVRYDLSNTRFVLLHFKPYIKLVDAKSGGVDAGTFTAGSWVKRTVTEDTDRGDNVVVSSSVIVLQAGTYRCNISCPAYNVSQNQARLYNATAVATILVGTMETTNTASNTQVRSHIVGEFTIAASQNLEIQHKCGATEATEGLGRAGNLGEGEIYTIAEFWKL